MGSSGDDADSDRSRLARRARAYLANVGGVRLQADLVRLKPDTTKDKVTFTGGQEIEKISLKPS